jgi:hypothetical protein
VSSDFGQLVGIRHLISGIDCAIAGAATAAAPTAPRPVTLIKSLRFIELPSLLVVSLERADVFEASCRSFRAFVPRLPSGWNIRFPNARRKSPALLAEAGLCTST